MPLKKHSLVILLIPLCINSRAQDKPVAAAHQQNILSVTPFQFTENGLGFGASYERGIDKKGFVAFYIPAMITFNVANSNRIYDYNTGNYNTGHANLMYYTMPGIKYYPTGSYGKVKYAIGLSAVIGSGKISDNLVNINGLNVTEQVQPHFVAGGMLQQSVNVHTGKSLYVGLELGLGYSFINETGGVKKDNEFLIQGGIKVGYRF